MLAFELEAAISNIKMWFTVHVFGRQSLRAILIQRITGFLNGMRYTNPRFTFTYLLTYLNSSQSFLSVIATDCFIEMYTQVLRWLLSLKLWIPQSSAKT